MRKILFLLVFSMTGALQAQTTGENLGTSWLKISPSTRNAGMGDSMAAASDAFDAVDLNPAELGLNRGNFLSFSQNFWAQDLSAQHLVYSAGSGTDGFGLGINYMNFGSIATYNVVGSVLTANGSYSPMGLNLYAGYGLGLAPGFRAGLTAHFIYDNIQQNLPDKTAALDAGLYYQPTKSSFRFSAVLANLGWDIDEAVLPLQLKLATAYQLGLSGPEILPDHLLILTAETDCFLENLDYNQFGLGAEYWYKNTIALRAGYQFSNIGDLTGLAGLSLGAGVRYLDWQVDYALITLGELGLANQIGLSLKWGGEVPPTATATFTATATTTSTAVAAWTATPTAAAGFKEEAGKGYKVTKDTITLYSDFKSKEPHPKDVELLDEVVKYLAANPGQKLTVDGYTDDRGPRKVNDKLSLARAQQVQKFLLAKGAPAEAVQWVKGHGPEDPVADNTTAEGQALNRRVVIHLMGIAAETVPPAASTSAMPMVEKTVATATPTMVLETPTLTPSASPSVMAPVQSTPTQTALSTQESTGLQGDYDKLVSETVPQLIAQGKMSQVGEVSKTFFSEAQQQKVSHERYQEMRSGYYTAVAKALIDKGQGVQAAYYLKLALSAQPDNTQALALQKQLQTPAVP